MSVMSGSSRNSYQGFTYFRPDFPDGGRAGVICRGEKPIVIVLFLSLASVVSLKQIWGIIQFLRAGMQPNHLD
jgi:hypothetical protein